MIVTRVQIRCDGVWSTGQGKPCGNTWSMRNDLPWEAGLAMARSLGWLLGVSEQWCPAHAQYRPRRTMQAPEPPVGWSGRGSGSAEDRAAQARR